MSFSFKNTYIRRDIIKPATATEGIVQHAVSNMAHKHNRKKAPYRLLQNVNDNNSERYLEDFGPLFYSITINKSSFYFHPDA